MSVTSIRNYFVMLVLPAMFIACESDVDIIYEAENIPIVYCLLNRYDSAHYVRLEKTFSGSKNAYNMARIPDSIYYANAQVRLDLWSGDFKYNSINLEPVYDIIKNKGIFASNNHLIYKTSDSITGTNISLVIELPEENRTVYASTKMIDPPRFRRPRNITKTIALFLTESFEIEFSGGSYNELGIRFYYSEYKNGFEEEKMVEIFKRHTIDPGSGKFYYILREENFLRPLLMLIKEDTAVIYRRFRKIDLIAYSANKDFSDFMELYQSLNDLNNSSFSNIINGYGLFASRSVSVRKDFSLSRRSLDSLANGRITRHLKFSQ